MEDWKKVMWSDESRLTLFQSDGSIRVRREAGEVMHPSCLVPTVQACGGSAVIWDKSETLEKLKETMTQRMRL